MAEQFQRKMQWKKKEDGNLEKKEGKAGGNKK